MQPDAAREVTELHKQQQQQQQQQGERRAVHGCVSSSEACWLSQPVPCFPVCKHSAHAHCPNSPPNSQPKHTWLKKASAAVR